MSKKIVSLLLCFTFLFTLLPTVVPGAEASNEALEISDLEYMKRLGVFPEDFVSGEPLTRYDLARIYFRILVPSLADSEYVKVDKPFSDLGDEHFAVSYTVKAGIMDGVSATEFNPEGNLSYTQIVKTLVCFLGYRAAAEANGGYPAGYNIYGSRFGFSDYASGEDNIVTTDIAAALFKIAVDTPVAETKILKDGGTVITRGDESYLEKYLGIYSVGGVVSGTYQENIYETGNVTDFYSVMIEDDKYLLNDDTVGLNDLLGYSINGVAKYNSLKNEYEMLYYELSDNKEYVAGSRDIINYDLSSGKICFYDHKDDVETLDVSDAYILYNDGLCENYDVSTINPFTDKTLDGKVIMIDNDSDKDIDVVRIEEYQSYVIKKIHNGKVYNVYHPSVIFDINSLEDGKVAVQNVVGNPISLSSLEAGDIISVFKDTKGNIKKIIASIDTYVGKIQEIVTEGDEILKLKIDGNYFQCANRLTYEVKTMQSLKAGDTVKMFFDFNEKISNVEIGDYSTEQIGYLMAMEPESGLSSQVNVKILTAMDTMLIAKMREKVNFNGKSMTARDVLTELGYVANVSNVVPQLVKYVYNKDKNMVTDIITVDDGIDETMDGFYRYTNLTDEMKDYFRSSTKSFNAKLLLSGSTVVFVVPEDISDLDDESYRATDSSFFKDGANTNMFEAYGSKANNPVAEALVVKTSSDGDNAIYKKTQYLIVKGCGQRIDDEGEPSWYVSGFVNGEEVNYLIEEEALKIDADGTAPDTGDVMYVGFDKNKKIVVSELIFDEAQRHMGPGFTSNPTSSNPFETDRFIYGSVTYFDDSSISLEFKDYAPGSELKNEHYPATGFKVYEYITTSRTPEIIVSSVDAIHDKYHNDYPANVLLYNRNIVSQFMIVFHE